MSLIFSIRLSIFSHLIFIVSTAYLLDNIIFPRNEPKRNIASRRTLDRLRSHQHHSYNICYFRTEVTKYPCSQSTNWIEILPSFCSDHLTLHWIIFCWTFLFFTLLSAKEDGIKKRRERVAFNTR